MTITLEELALRVKDNQFLPDYIVANQTDQPPTVLITPAATITFPLSEKDKDDLALLIRKFEVEINCSGLAAPQIGISKRALIFAVEDDPIIKKWRPDLTQFMPKTIWLNPSWAPVGDNMHEDFEACFSVDGVAAPVMRYTNISYEAYDLDGNLVTGEAEGFLARVIQHETDHLNGKLYTMHVSLEQIMNIEDYRRRRREAMEKEEKEAFEQEAITEKYS